MSDPHHPTMLLFLNFFLCSFVDNFLLHHEWRQQQVALAPVHGSAIDRRLEVVVKPPLIEVSLLGVLLCKGKSRRGSGWEVLVLAAFWHQVTRSLKSGVEEEQSGWAPHLISLPRGELIWFFQTQCQGWAQLPHLRQGPSLSFSSPCVDYAEIMGSRPLSSFKSSVREVCLHINKKATKILWRLHQQEKGKWQCEAGREPRRLGERGYGLISPSQDQVIFKHISYILTSIISQKFSALLTSMAKEYYVGIKTWHCPQGCYFHRSVVKHKVNLPVSLPCLIF